ncbi:twinkle protein [Bradyrhizobium barranii subsp. barranii]
MVSFSNATTADLRVTQSQMSDSAIEWARVERKISLETLRRLPVASGNVFFPDINRRSDALIFNYPEGWKARAYPEKAFTSGKGTALTFWNIEAVLNGPLEDVYIAEGELDGCALVESGLPADQVLAAPAASGGSYEYVIEALSAGLARAKRIIWCGDQDSAGLKLRAAMAQLFGIARFYFVNWPEGSKDANDHLRSDGAQAVRELVLYGLLPWPTSGLYRMSELPDPPPMTIWSPGFNSWGHRCKLAAGTLSVVTGHPGMGKTTVFGQVWFQVVDYHDLVACIASFETRPKPHLRRQLRTLKGRKLESVMTDREIADADRWINEHYLFMAHPDRRPDLQWLLSQAEAAVHRHGVRVLQIDPWNRLEASREPRESETDYIGRCLRELYNFAVDLDCHVQILAHPAKAGDGYRRSDPPELEHIHGSKHWDNMVDQGFVVHRPRLFDDKGEREFYTELHHKKSRFEELGYATKFGLEFQSDSGRFADCKLAAKKSPAKQHDQATMFEGGE